MQARSRWSPSPTPRSSTGRRTSACSGAEAEHQLARDLADEPHHRSARVAEWLRGELEASYHLLEEAAAPMRSGQRLAAFDPLEELGELVVRRDYTKLASCGPSA